MSTKEVFHWYSPQIEQDAQLVRWGHFGTPVLIFPTAGGDAEEIERFHLIRAIAPLIDAGRIKVYSIDSVAGKAWISGDHSAEYCSKLQNGFDAYIYSEVVPAIRRDCQDDAIGIWATGASIGAFHSVAVVCRFPDMFHRALAMSGTFNLMRFIETDRMSAGKHAHVRERRGDVLERSRPSAARIAEPPVFDRPRREPLAREGRRARSHVVHAVGRLPASAVDQHDQRAIPRSGLTVANLAALGQFQRGGGRQRAAGERRLQGRRLKRIDHMVQQQQCPGGQQHQQREQRPAPPPDAKAPFPFHTREQFA